MPSSAATPAVHGIRVTMGGISGGALVPLTLLLGLIFLVFSPPEVEGQESSDLLRRMKVPYKGFVGLRVTEDAILQVYYNDQTIAVIELGPDKQLLNCELVEVYEPQMAKEALQNLTRIAKPYPITFQEMLMLMYQCHGLTALDVGDTGIGNMIKMNQYSSIFQGILPGTKWCGIGDIAETYYNLGSNSNLDKCCRNHDLCPVKVRAYSERYNLTNPSFYTRSHCDCDSMLYKCLKATNNRNANIMGIVYFNVFKIPCIMDIDEAIAVREMPLTKRRKFHPVLHSY